MTTHRKSLSVHFDSKAICTRSARSCTTPKLNITDFKGEHFNLTTSSLVTLLSQSMSDAFCTMAEQCRMMSHAVHDPTTRIAAAVNKDATSCCSKSADSAYCPSVFEDALTDQILTTRLAAHQLRNRLRRSDWPSATQSS